MRLHGVVLNYLSPGATLPFYFTCQQFTYYVDIWSIEKIRIINTFFEGPHIESVMMKI
jgi:hypothetical protein